VAERLLLIDDDADLGPLMAEFFSERGLTLDCALNGKAGLDRLAANPYDLVILDVMMPGIDGFEVLRLLREKSKVPVLMLTARTEQASRIRGLEGGADDYLPKPFDPLELLARVRAILRRAAPAVTSKVIEASGVRLDPGARSVTQNGHQIAVTSIEYDILEVLIRAAGSVVSRDDLMNRLYQREATPFDRSIDVHVSHLRKKLADSDALIRTVRGIGYQFCAPESTP
jgi:two-component system response regulator CpxR